MAVPIIDGIDSNDFRYSPVYQKDTHSRGKFLTLISLKLLEKIQLTAADVSWTHLAFVDNSKLSEFHMVV